MGKIRILNNDSKIKAVNSHVIHRDIDISSTEFIKVAHNLVGKPSDDWMNYSDIMRISSCFGLSGIIEEQNSNHARLILDIDWNQCEIYDPLRGILKEPLRKSSKLKSFNIPKGSFKLIYDDSINVNNLDFLINEEKYRLKSQLVEGYESHLPRLQHNSYDCVPLSLFAALHYDADHPEYSKRINWEILKEKFA